MGLSEKEIDELIKKLREKIKKSTVEYDTRLFNIEAFEDRYQVALRSRMNLEAFILAEIANYEKIKTQLENERNIQEPEQNTFSDKIDRIIEDNTASHFLFR